MKPQTMLTVFMSVGILLCLPGCGGSFVDWADETFYQSRVTGDHVATIKPFLKDVRLYDQFDTLAMFDALWLSDQVRTAYAQVYAKMVGKDEEGYTDFLRRELSANTYFVSFYVLSLNTIQLTDVPPLWSMHLDIDGKKYAPSEIKSVELSPEFVTFFGKRLTNHKRPYEVRFNRKDANSKDILEGKKCMKLFFCSPRYYDGTLVWDLDKLNTSVVAPLDLSDPAIVEKEKQKNEDAAAQKKKDEHKPRRGRVGSFKQEEGKKEEQLSQPVTLEEREAQADKSESVEFDEDLAELSPVDKEIATALPAGGLGTFEGLEESEADSIEGFDGALLGGGMQQ